MEDLDNGKKYPKDLKQVLNKCVKHIRDNMPKFKDRPTYDKSEMGTIRNSNFYSILNVGERFVSFDVRKANYNASRLHFPELFKSNWPEFLSQFTDSQFIIESKHFRQMVFGQAGLTKYSVENLAQHELEPFYQYLNAQKPELFNMGTLIYKKGDEIIFKLSVDADVSEILQMEKDYEKDIFKPEIFTLQKLPNCKYYYKQHYNGHKTPKTMPKNYVLQIIKKMEGRDITTLDLTGVDGEGVPFVYSRSIFDLD